MNPSVQRYLDAASGLTNITASKAEKLVKQMVRSGEAASDQVGELVDDLLERQRKNRDAMSEMVKTETTRAVRAMGLATSTEVERLQKQVAELKRELAQLQRSSGASQTARGGTVVKKSTAKRTATKKSTAKKTAAKKTAAKKTAAKKTAAQRQTTRSDAGPSSTPAGKTPPTVTVTEEATDAS